MDSISNEFLDDLAKKGMVKKATESSSVIIRKAYDEATHQFFKKMFIASMYANFVEQGTLPEETTDPKHIKLIEDAVNRTMTKPPYFFMTINPQKGTSLEALQIKVEKFTARKIVQRYCYVYEVRREEDVKEDQGLHCHMIIKYQNIRPYDFKVAAKNTFKTICDSQNPHCLNFKQISENIIEDKVNYMLGNKKDAKLSGVIATVNYRTANELDEIYDSSPPFPCRATQLIELTPLEQPALIRQ